MRSGLVAHMKQGTIKKGRHVTKEDLTLSPKEIKVFLHNAQLALCDAVSDDAIDKKLYKLKNALLGLFQYSLSNLTPAEVSLVLVSAAWDIFNEEGGHLENHALGHRNVPNDRN
jgi:hypothetical protein